MLLREHIALAAFVVLSQFLSIGVFGQTPAAASSNSAQATGSPSPSPAAVAPSAVVSEADSVAQRLRAIREPLANDTESSRIGSEIPVLSQQIEAADVLTRDALAGKPSLDELDELADTWRPILRQIQSSKSTLREQIEALDKQIAELDRFSETWALTLAAIRSGDETENTSRSNAGLPPEVLQKVTDTIAAIDETARLVQERRAGLLSIQTRLSEMEARATDSRDQIRGAQSRTLTNLFNRDEPPIWAPQANVLTGAGLVDKTVQSLKGQAAELRVYAADRVPQFAAQGVAFTLITIALFWARRRIQPFIEIEPKLEKAAQIFALPAATGLILTVVLSSWFYPQAPELLTAIIGAAALVPVVLLLRRMVERPLFPILNALVVFYFVDLLREILSAQPFTRRIVFMAEMLGGVAFLVWFLKSKRLSGGVEAAHYRIFASIRKVVPFALAIFAVAFAASALGWVSLAEVIGNGVLGSAYIALIIYTAVQIVRGMIIFALRIPVIAATRVVKKNRALIRERSVRIVWWIAFVLWALLTLRLFAVRQPLFSFLRSVFTASATVGTVQISLGSVVLFFLTIWIAVLISRFLRFILEEEVYPSVDLGGGVSYAVSTMLHYTILVIAFLIAIGLLGVDFTKFALIGGAIGIGIGFGLQNIINNFVSGLILLFERPVKVGDTIQIDTQTGKLTQIGLRASVLRKVDGSDVIVPNSRLISEEVTNWTMSDDKRRMDILVGVAYGSDPDQVMALLTKAAVTKPEVLTEPAPKAIFTGFGENSIDFELRAWSEDTDKWVGLRSEIVTDIYRSFNEANIEFPYPQRDLNIRSIDQHTVDELKRAAKS